MTDQIPQVAGAILILTAFVAAQRGVMDQHARTYLVLNVLGAGILTGVALHEQDWGFFMLEAVWTAVSIYGLIQLHRRPPGVTVGKRPKEQA